MCILPGVEAGQVEQVLGEPLEPVDLLAHRLEELAPGRFVQLLVGHELEEAAQREERRSQLVRGVADELAPRALELREAQTHPVEGARELAELVLAPVDDGLVEPAGRDALGRQLQAPDPAGEEVRQAVAHARAPASSARTPASSMRRWTVATFASASWSEAESRTTPPEGTATIETGLATSAYSVPPR